MNARMYFTARQRGLSLVESLVGMALTLALIAGVAQVLLSTQFNTRSQNDRASMDDAARFAIEYLSRAGQRAGFKRNPDDDDGGVFLEVPGGFPKGASVFGTDTTLSLRYQGHADRQLANCQNLAADSEGQVYTETWVVNGTQLQCTLTTPSSTTGTPQALIDNVEAVNFQYGEDTDSDRYPNLYRNASAVVNWADVTSVRVSLRMVSTSNNLTETPQPFIDFNGQPTTSTDRRLRRNVFTTVALRNRLP
jgi:Tfp pilus assembly protein PilW